MIMDGKVPSAQLLEQLAQEVSMFKSRRPSMISVLFKNNPDAESYARHIDKCCRNIGIEYNYLFLPQDIEQIQAIEQIEKLNLDPKIDGILLHMPLPPSLSFNDLALSIDPSKDIDGIHPLNLGRLFVGKPVFVGATPLAIMHLLDYYDIKLKGQKALVMGRSNIVGKPVALLLLSKDCTVTVAHSKSQHLQTDSKSADILIAAIGKAHFVSKNYIKNGAVVVDVGINFIEGKMTGDVDYHEVSPVASYITPVPGGVGSVTTAMMLKNVVKAFKLHECV